jgi:cytochrome c2
MATGLAAMLLLFSVLLVGCGEGRTQSPGDGNPRRGAELIRYFGCGACHMIPGVAGADGVVGPPLTAIGRRIFIAGVLPNSPENMMAWLQDPQRFVPGNAMPAMGIGPNDARDLTAYLATLK